MSMKLSERIVALEALMMHEFKETKDLISKKHRIALKKNSQSKILWGVNFAQAMAIIAGILKLLKLF